MFILKNEVRFADKKFLDSFIIDSVKKTLEKELGIEQIR